MNYSDEMGKELSPYVTLVLCEAMANTESVGEYTLPDYQAEIRRVLSVTPTVLPPAKYLGASGVELSGTVDYSVLYVGADGALYTLPLSSEYHLTLPVEANTGMELGDGVCVWSDVLAESTTARVSSPRKLSLRCRLRALVRAFGKMLMEERRVGECDDSAIFRRTMRAENLSATLACSEVVHCSCDFGGGEELRVISADATPIVDDVRLSGDRATLSGEIFVKLLVADEQGGTRTLSRSLPLAGEVEIEGAEESDEFRALGTLSELAVSVEDGGRINCEISVLLELRGMRRQEIVYTEDLFSEQAECSCEKGSYRLPVALRCDRRNLSQSERISLSEVHGFPEGASICDAWGSILFSDCAAHGSKYVLSGESRYTLLCEKDGEYSTVELSIPLRYETEGGEQAPESFSAHGRIISCRVRTEGETLCLDSELAIAADFIGFCEIFAVREARFGAPITDRASRMVVYYPSENEDLWAVAKKYRIAPEKISQSAAYYYF